MLKGIENSFEEDVEQLIMIVAFSSLARISGECPTIHSPPVPFFLKVEISSHTLILLFMAGSVHSGSAS